MAALFADENFPLPVVQELRKLGHNVLTTAEAGLAGRATPDGEILHSASSDHRVLLALNRRHFIRLHAENPINGGIIVCTVDRDHASLAGRIHEQLRSSEGLISQLVRVNRPD